MFNIFDNCHKNNILCHKPFEKNDYKHYIMFLYIRPIKSVLHTYYKAL